MIEEAQSCLILLFKNFLFEKRLVDLYIWIIPE